MAYHTNQCARCGAAMTSSMEDSAAVAGGTSLESTTWAYRAAKPVLNTAEARTTLRVFTGGGGATYWFFQEVATKRPKGSARHLSQSRSSAPGQGHRFTDSHNKLTNPSDWIWANAQANRISCPCLRRSRAIAGWNTPASLI